MADRRLKIFHTVARLLNFTKAAEELHMTQPAVTFQIRQLEEQFNTRLFDRTHNKVSLTDVGHQVFEYADRILKLYEDMTRSINDMTGDVSGGVALGASTTIAEYMLPLMIGEFKEKYPDVMISLKESNTEDIVSMVENNVIDLGIVEGYVNNKNLVVEECKMDQLVVIMPNNHPLAEQKAIHVKEIVAHPFISREHGSGTQEVITKYIEQHGDHDLLDVCFELSSPEAIKGAVEAGMGISIVSKATILKELRLGSLTAVNLSPKLERPFSFVRQRYKFKSRAADELLSFAQDFCKKA
ncbi:MAG: selenium metabolism-associated LysR family transcriptional regulator [Gammaproteobacteria bacterium]|nr:selenium metabolism-associated LysR family transcriptional regulator [Gammaproteobacteria bacterium]MCW8923205.1 selenium metabolism-associated LysR family transcriptional regulator [Gammaproteobacteria bacterium]